MAGRAPPNRSAKWFAECGQKENTWPPCPVAFSPMFFSSRHTGARTGDVSLEAENAANVAELNAIRAELNATVGLLQTSLETVEDGAKKGAKSPG